MRIDAQSTSVVTKDIVKDNTKTNDKLKQACQDFEAVLTSMMFKSMRSSVSKTDLFGSEKEESMFRDMMDDEICKRAAKSGSNGIAEMLYRELNRNVGGLEND